MGLKEFFKPTKGKVLALVALLLLIFVYSYFAIPCPTDGGNNHCGKLPDAGFKLLGWPFGAAILLLSKLGTLRANTSLLLLLKLILSISIFTLGLIANFLYLYAISTAFLNLIRKVKLTGHKK